MEILGHKACIYGTLGDKASQFSKADGTSLHTYQQYVRGLVALHLGQHLVLSALNFSHSGGVVGLHCDFILHLPDN